MISTIHGFYGGYSPKHDSISIAELWGYHNWSVQQMKMEALYLQKKLWTMSLPWFLLVLKLVYFTKLSNLFVSLL